MICSNCKMRWADFPKEYFEITDKGIIAKSKEAEQKRQIAFESDEIRYCGCIENDNAIENYESRW